MSIDARFENFNQRHPEIYDILKSTALKWVARGAKRISAKGLYEFCRMDNWMRRESGEPWALNNSFTSRYARMLADEPELRGLIELRTLKNVEESNTEVEVPEELDIDAELMEAGVW